MKLRKFTWLPDIARVQTRSQLSCCFPRSREHCNLNLSQIPGTFFAHFQDCLSTLKLAFSANSLLWALMLLSQKAGQNIAAKIHKNYAPRLRNQDCRVFFSLFRNFRFSHKDIRMQYAPLSKLPWERSGLRLHLWKDCFRREPTMASSAEFVTTGSIRALDYSICGRPEMTKSFSQLCFCNNACQMDWVLANASNKHLPSGIRFFEAGRTYEAIEL